MRQTAYDKILKQACNFHYPPKKSIIFDYNRLYEYKNISIIFQIK